MTISKAGASSPRRVFVLGGGGNLGAVQVGMLRALWEAGVTPDALVGASVGAINAAVLAFHPGPDGIDRLERLWRPLHVWQVFPLDVPTLAHGLLHGGKGLVTPKGLRSILDQAGLTGTRLEDAATRLVVVATDLASDRPLALSSGDSVEALLASAALPRVFPPVQLDGHLLVDGAIHDDLPLASALALDPSEVYLLPAHPSDAPNSPRQGVTVHALPIPPVVRRVPPYDFGSVDRLIASAYGRTRSWLAGEAGADLRELAVA